MNVTTNEKHLHFINFMKLIEESNTSEVLGSFSTDHAALFTVSKNLKTNELSLAFQKDGNPIYSLSLRQSDRDRLQALEAKKSNKTITEEEKTEMTNLKAK